MENLNFEKVISSRRSIRNFESRPIEKEIINKIIKVATMAPSACNIQGWNFIVIDEETTKQKLVDMGSSVILKNAPVVILVLYDNRTINSEYSDHVQSAAAAIQNLLLGATYFGLGSCWICHLPPKNQLRRALAIPQTLDPIAYVLLGYKKNDPAPVSRKYSVADLISYNKFEGKITQGQNRFSILITKVLMKAYYLTPLFIKRSFLNKFIDKRFIKKFEN